MTTLIMVLIGIFILAGWGTAEMNYRSEKKKAAKFRRMSLLYKQKSEKLESVIEHKDLQFDELNDAYEYSKINGEKHRQTKADNEVMHKEIEKYSATINWLDKKVRSREYTGNSLARVIKTHLDNEFPDEKQQEQQQIKESKEVFQRIKKTMGGS